MDGWMEGSVDPLVKSCMHPSVKIHSNVYARCKMEKRGKDLDLRRATKAPWAGEGHVREEKRETFHPSLPRPLL